MGSDLQHEDLIMKLRAKLNEEKIKLWEEPFYDNDKASPTKKLEELAQNIATSLSLEYSEVLSGLIELQSHSVERSKANNEFRSSGVALLRVKLSVPEKKSVVINLRSKLDIDGEEFYKIVGKEMKMAVSRIKLIFNGKIIKHRPTLEEQGLKNGALLLALVMSETPDEIQKEDKIYTEMKNTREDALLLTEYVDDLGNDDEYMQLEDQSGNTVNLPAAERKALLVGLTLHEKGRAAMKDKDWPLALVLLLEADRHFSECNAGVLGSVDNVALLQLDISWCYIQLESVNAAPDAARRLERAESTLLRSYGENLQRPRALKGSDANERTVLMRLYLLKAVVNYHQNKREEARTLLNKAELELQKLKVDESSVAALMELGWTVIQARSGLRAREGDVQAAHNFLTDEKEARKAARAQAKAERIKRSLGQCLNGEYVNETFVELLEGMGYPRRTAVLALKNSNNHVSQAVQIIQEQPDLICLEENANLASSSYESFTSECSDEPDFEKIEQLKTLGYSEEMAAESLKRHGNNFDDALDELSRCNGFLDDFQPSTSGQSSSAKPTKGKKRRMSSQQKKRKEQEAAFERLQKALSNTQEDDYLDSTLEQEEEFIARYKSLLI